MSVNIKTALQTAANKSGVDEGAATNLANWLIEQGYEMSKPTKNTPDQEAIEASESAQKRQTGTDPTTTPADVKVNQLRTGEGVNEAESASTKKG